MRSSADPADLAGGGEPIAIARAADQCVVPARQGVRGGQGEGAGRGVGGHCAVVTAGREGEAADVVQGDDLRAHHVADAEQRGARGDVGDGAGGVGGVMGEGGGAGGGAECAVGSE